MDKHGRQAVSPWQMPLAAWIATAKRTWAETNADNVGLVAAGVAFYGFLALVPLLAATVLIYGLAAAPATVMRDVTQLASVMPADVAKLIGEQLMNVVQTSDGKKGFGLALALGLALFGARNGATAIITALNIAYEEEESRGFLRVNLLAIAMTAASVLVAVLASVAIAALGHLESVMPQMPEALLVLGKVAVYALLTLAGAAAAATLYRYGPSRKRARWVWLTPGSLFAALMWLALTAGFGIYVANFGNYNATYGSLGAVVVTLTWLYLSSYILIFGAELNSELEHQTAQDTTSANAPLGARGAWVADHVAESGTSNARPPHPQPDRAHVPGSIAAGPLAAQIARWAGLPRVGWTSSAAATIGLALLRRGKAAPGVALLGTVAALAWLGRRPRPDSGRIEAVFFDVDGTLVDSNERHVAVWQHAFREQGLEVPPDAIRAQIGKGGDLLVPALVPGADAELVDTLSKRHGALFAADHLDAVRPFPGAGALLTRVKASGRTVVLASSAKGQEVRHYLRLLAAGDVVDATTSIDDVEVSKPAADIFAAALAKVKPLAPSQVMVVGDTPYDVEAAARCGIRTVAVRSGRFSDAALIGAGAIALYDDVAALLRDFDHSPIVQDERPRRLSAAVTAP